MYVYIYIHIYICMYKHSCVFIMCVCGVCLSVCAQRVRSLL